MGEVQSIKMATWLIQNGGSLASVLLCGIILYRLHQIQKDLSGKRWVDICDEKHKALDDMCEEKHRVVNEMIEKLWKKVFNGNSPS